MQTVNVALKNSDFNIMTLLTFEDMTDELVAIPELKVVDKEGNAVDFSISDAVCGEGASWLFSRTGMKDDLHFVVNVNSQTGVTSIITNAGDKEYNIMIGAELGNSNRRIH